MITLLIFLCFRSIFASEIQFFNKMWTIDSFEGLKKNVDCMLKEGQWVNFRQQLFSKSCSSTENHYTAGKCDSQHYPRPSLDYSWETNELKCNNVLLPFSRERICKKMDGKNFMFVGDSIMEEFYATFMSTLHENGECRYSESMTAGHSHRSPCSNSNISSIRENYFTVSSDPQSWGPPGLKVPRWHKLLVKNKVDVIIANRGIHTKNDSIVLTQLNETFHYMRMFHPNVSIIYRSTSFPHQNCVNRFADPPLKEPLPFIPINERLVSPKGLGLNRDIGWDHVQSGNDLVKEFIDKNFPEVLHMDLSSNRLRADSHMVMRNDCLHFCIPGPIDSWVIFLDNVLNLL